METEDTFFKKIIGKGGHANYVQRFSADAGPGAGRNRTMGFRLKSNAEPDAMHSREC